MPFDQYEGRLIADLLDPYLNWFAREGFPRGEIGQLFHLMHEIDHNGLSPFSTRYGRDAQDEAPCGPCARADGAK